MPWDIVYDDAAVMQAMRRAPDTLDRELRGGITAASLVVEAAVVGFTPVGATGILRGSITHDLSGSGVDLTGTVYSTDVPIKVASVETGRAPGRMPPIGAIQSWVDAKVGGGRNVAFLIARAIGRRGTKGAHMFEKGYNASRGRALALLEAAVDRALRSL